jgi:plasmid stabilization system protein ParE
MIFDIEIEDDALEEIRDAHDYYEKQKEGLGDQFQKELKRCFSKIQTNPRNYSKIKHEIRQAPLEKFQFSVIYEISGQHIIVIYAVFHKSRNPEFKWRRK